jgi:NAD(P)-dependent dehydrogenase (short-subunit alcohol dehydrogenase family)
MTARTALVTGGGRNIGRAICLALADAGLDVAVVAGRNVDEAEQVAEEVRSRGVSAAAFGVDLGDPDDVETLVGKVTAALGPVDVLVANAARRPHQSLTEISVNDWDSVLAANLSSTFYFGRLVLPGMAERNFGRMIAIGGPDGQRGAANRAHNVAAKAGLIGLMKAVAIEFGPLGVTANVVVPGITDTTRDPKDYPHWPFSQDQLKQRLHIPRLGRAEEVADACAFLASDNASYITGQTLHVSGGYYMP